MAVALDVLSGPGGTGAGGHIFSGTGISGTGATIPSFQNIGASATLLTVVISINDSLANIGTMSINWDSAGTNQAMTLINSVQATGGGQCVFLFGLVNPTPGTKSIKFTWSGGAAGDSYEIMGASWTGTVSSSVAAATEGANTATGSSASVSVTTSVAIPAGDAAFSGLIPEGTSITITSGTSNDTDTTQLTLGSARYSGAGSTITGTATAGASTPWAAAIVGIKAPAVATHVGIVGLVSSEW